MKELEHLFRKPIDEIIMITAQFRQKDALISNLINEGYDQLRDCRKILGL